jgi:FkbM family methyltransferase
MSRYTIKRRVMRPITAWRRRRAGPMGPNKLAMLQAHDFRPAMQSFFAAVRQEPTMLYDVDLRDGAVAVDVGGYHGEWTKQILGRATELGVGDFRVHVFEPEPSCVDELHTAFDGDARVRVHPFGLGGRDRTERMAVGGLGTSQFKSTGRNGFVATIAVDIRDVDGVLLSLGVERIDVMMINIEGGEYEVLDRMHEKGLLGRVETFFVQFHEFAPDAYRARRRNRQHLSATHACTWNYTWVYERWDRR